MSVDIFREDNLSYSILSRVDLRNPRNVNKNLHQNAHFLKFVKNYVNAKIFTFYSTYFSSTRMN